MCYSFTPVRTPDGILWLPKKVVDQYEKDGWVERADEVFPRGPAEVWRWIKGGVQSSEMVFDMVPRFYLKAGNPSLDEVLKRKRSKKKGGDGFDSYNARSESILEKATFRAPWAEGKRMVVPVSAWRERPNMEEAPPEFKGREFRIHLSDPKNLAGIWERWENKQGEILESFAIITVDSLGNDMLRGIWHERCPLILDHRQVEEWLDPKTSPEQAFKMIRPYPSDEMKLEEIIRPRPDDPQLSLFAPPA
ncbi:MAG: SOS response-associated peptidase family protein [Fibrobacteria bacterium]